MLGSEFDGERANAAALADRLVRDAGLTWTDVIVAPRRDAVSRGERETADFASARDYVNRLVRDYAQVERCLDRADLFSTKQIAFLEGLNAWLRDRGPLTPRQRAVLAELVARVAARDGRAA
jgi:hypothetical protein